MRYVLFVGYLYAICMPSMCSRNAINALLMCYPMPDDAAALYYQYAINELSLYYQYATEILLKCCRFFSIVWLCLGWFALAWLGGL